MRKPEFCEVQEFLAECPYTILDVETTGLSPYEGDRICEIAFMKIFPNGRVTQYTRLVNPDTKIKRSAYLVNRIKNEELLKQPRIVDIFHEIEPFFSGSVIVAYNAGFDLSFIERCNGVQSERLVSGCRYIDLFCLAKSLYSKLDYYRLANVAAYLDISFKEVHRALADTALSEKVFRRMLIDLERRNRKLPIFRYAN